MNEIKNTIQVDSEIGKLNGVILHSPGPEVENMTPRDAERALYSDILNLKVAGAEYRQLKSVLNKITKTYEIQDLLTDVLGDDDCKNCLVNKICEYENVWDLKEFLLDLSPSDLSKSLIEGVVMVKDNLTKFLNKEKYSLKPLHNFFFTRDASMAIGKKVLIGKMANQVREREAKIMEAIFNYHPDLRAVTVNPDNDYSKNPELTIEGGDVIVAREDILLIGIGARTTPKGVDYIIEKFKRKTEKKHIIVQKLPKKPESFIHLDMIFTFLDKDMCMVYDPIVIKQVHYQTVLITIAGGKVIISEEDDILRALKKLGMDLKPVCCGGSKGDWFQDREQWHSGANFFAIAPGQVIGYGRNEKTIEEMDRLGFEVIHAQELIDEKKSITPGKRTVITIDGSELSRGGGGCRCMTMPVNRGIVKW